MAETVRKRPLTQILEQAGRRSMLVSEGDGRKQARYRLLAEHVWNAVTTGRTTLPDGADLELSPKEWITMVQWLYSHIDGSAPSKVDISSLGEQLNFKVYSGFDPDKV